MLKRLIRQIEKAFRYDTPKTHRLNEFWKFEDILDDLEEGLKEHIGDRNTTTYEEILSWLILLIETVDKIRTCRGRQTMHRCSMNMD